MPLTSVAANRHQAGDSQYHPQAPRIRPFNTMSVARIVPLLGLAASVVGVLVWAVS